MFVFICAELELSVKKYIPHSCKLKSGEEAVLKGGRSFTDLSNFTQGMVGTRAQAWRCQ